LESDETVNGYFVRSELCKTLGGNRCDLLTISNDFYDYTRKVIVLTARVHSGETVSSFKIKGVIDFLLSDSP